MRLTCCLFLCVLQHAVFSQDRSSPDYTEVKGVLIDSLTSQPIPSVHIWTRHFKTASHPDGSFSILTLTNDSIHFSHIGYYTIVFPLHLLKQSSPLRIAMTQKAIQLNSVEVYRLSEESFKKTVLETAPVASPEEENANTNIAILKYYIKSLPQLPMNANENYREQIKGPQGVTIFSSGGQKGLIKAIRDVIKMKPTPYKSFSIRKAPSPEIKYNIFSDSSSPITKQRIDTMKLVKGKK